MDAHFSFLQLPIRQPEAYASPSSPASWQCTCQAHVQQSCRKIVRDIHHTEVQSFRVKCMRCCRTFRHYPAWVSQADTITAR